MKTIEQAQAELAATKQEIGRAFAPICAWYYPPGRTHNFRRDQAPHAAMWAVGTLMSRRWSEARANLNTALDQQAQ